MIPWADLDASLREPRGPYREPPKVEPPKPHQPLLRTWAEAPQAYVPLPPPPPSWARRSLITTLWYWIWGD